VTALGVKRIARHVRATTIELSAAAATYYQGALVGFDTATGLIKKGQPLTTFWPIGLCSEDTVLSGTGLLPITLFRELTAYWFLSDGSVDAATVGNLCYVVDDQTVAKTDAANTLSVAGRVWRFDSSVTPNRVLVEPVFIAVGDLSGVDS
jgi:hypothetical protein